MEPATRAMRGTHLLLWSTLLAALIMPSPAGAQAVSPEPIHIYFSAGCADCWPYVEDVLIPALQEGGVEADWTIHDYTLPAERAHLLEMADEIDLPRSIADSLYAFVPYRGGTLVILGHVPADLIGQVLASPDVPQRLVLWQPQMHGEPSEYRLWAWAGDVETFAIDTPFAQALPQAIRSEGPLPVGLANLDQLLPAVIVTGLLDSINPCAFAVILLLLAFLFTLRQSRQRILQLGGVYIGMIFLVYFAIGLGILRAIRLSGDPHFVARAGSWILIGLGFINLIEYFYPRFPIKLHMPAFAGDKTNELLKRATLPATIGVGFLVGLCTFPCSGGIYVSIITLLNAKTTLGWGIGYLALYNVLFVLPLILILVAVGNRMAAKRWASWERQHARRIRLWYGLIMVGLGVIMLTWVIG
ncbi:MAG TPA: cytochrome c biogenesis protein CcdA [Anaerolineales bacterium]|nr:cytochrome c biogenesis protein CcdA [Anaerolineales bacterium]